MEVELSTAEEIGEMGDEMDELKNDLERETEVKI